MLKNILTQETIQCVLSKEFLKLKPETKTVNAVEQMMRNNFSEVFIVDEMADGECILGILTTEDLSAIKQANQDLEKPIASYGLKKVVSVSPETKIASAKKILDENEIECLPVIEHSSIIGIVRKEDVLQKYCSNLEISIIHYMTAISQLHEAVTMTDDQGNVILWNENAEKMYNINANDILNKKLEEFFPNALIQSVLKTGIPIENVYHSPKPNYYVVISAIPIFVDGKFIGVVSTERDITEYKHLSNQLDNANIEIDLLKREVSKIANDNYSFGGIVGNNQVIKKCIDLALQVSTTDTSVMLTGESGTGKEVFARAIHMNSLRKGLFVPVNCSAIPSALFESEFFGYVGGAFTGALKTGKIGFFEIANEGTIFLDEIGDLPLEHQAKLLRVLQDGMISKVGAERRIPVNVRVVCATNKKLIDMVKRGVFREDLYYRLNVVEISLPALRERREDIVILFNKFVEESCSKKQRKIPHVENDVFKFLLQYIWPGNIRELKNVVEYMLIIGSGDRLSMEAFPPYLKEYFILNQMDKKMMLRSGTESDENFKGNLDKKLHDVECEMISNALNKHNGNKKKTAASLGIPRSTLYYKMAQCGIDK